MAEPSTPPDTLRVVKVFLASPGDVAEERRMVRGLIEELNQVVARRLGIRLELYGWEDQRPRTGRAQEVINREVRACHLFIGMLAERWGTPTGKDTSGFHEEYRTALARYRDTEGKEPEIMLVFREVEAARRSDPGEQLTKVLQFRKQVEEERALLFQDYRDTDELRTKLRLWLEAHLFDAVAPASLTGGRLALSGGPANAEAVMLSPADLPAHRQAHLLETLDTLQGALTQATFDGYAERALEVSADRLLRLRLFVTAWLRVVHGGEPLGTHDVNSLYQIRTDVDLIPPEHALLEETLLGDTDNVLPGWYWFREQGEKAMVDALLSTALGHRRTELRARAIRLLGSAGVRFRDADFTALLADAAKNDGGALAASLVEHLRDTGDGRRLGALAQADAFIPNFPRKEQFEALLKVRASESLEAAIDEAIRGFGQFPESATALIEDHIAAIGDEHLRRMMVDPKAQKLVDIATRVLISREKCDTEQLRTALHSPSARTRAAAVDALIASGGPLTPQEIREALPKQPTTLLAALQIGDSEERGISVEDTLVRFFRSRTPEELLALSDTISVDSEPAYRALGLQHFATYGSRIRQDLQERFGRARERYLQASARLNQFGITSEESTAAFYAQQFVPSALAVLAEHGGPADVPFAVDYLSSSNAVEPEPAIRLITRHGEAQHIPVLLAFAERSYGPGVTNAAQAALTLAPGPDGAAPALLASGKVALVRAGLAALRGGGPEVALKHAEPLLGDARDGARLAATALLAEELDHDTLEQVMIRYRARESYYYDVGCWLDRVLYAAEPLNRVFRLRLRSRLQ